MRHKGNEYSKLRLLNYFAIINDFQHLVLVSFLSLQKVPDMAIYDKTFIYLIILEVQGHVTCHSSVLLRASWQMEEHVGVELYLKSGTREKERPALLFL